MVNNAAESWCIIIIPNSVNSSYRPLLPSGEEDWVRSKNGGTEDMWYVLAEQAYHLYFTFTIGLKVIR